MNPGNLARQLYSIPVSMRPEDEEPVAEVFRNMFAGRIEPISGPITLGETDIFGVPLPAPEKSGSVAIIPVKGVLARDLHPIEKSFGFIDYNDLMMWIEEAMEDDSISGIAFDINSPGGSSVGMIELGETIQAASDKKPVLAYTAGLMASAAYIPFAACTGIYCSKSALVGSVGAYMYLIDWSGYFEKVGLKAEVIVNTGGIYKAAGAQGTSLTEEQRAQFQDQVDHCYAQAVNHIGMNRAVDPEYLKGQVVFGDEAVGSGLADQVGDLRMTLHDLSLLSDPRRFRTS